MERAAWTFTRAGVLLLISGSVAGCDQAPAPVAPGTGHDPAFHHSSAPTPETEKWLAGLRAALAPYQRFETAYDAGYQAVFADACFELPGSGGMGYHYVKGGLVDGVVEEFAPEALMFEPQKNGRLRLVGVEFVVPFSQWTGATPPVLHGQEYHPNHAFGLWTLHVWIFKHNPAGMFADWNPTVSCSWAT